MRLHGNARTCLHSRRLIVGRVIEAGVVAGGGGRGGRRERADGLEVVAPVPRVRAMPG